MGNLKVGINGFGRIGRLVCRGLLNTHGVEVVKINDLTDNKTLAHLYKYDSVHGRIEAEISGNDTHLIIGDKQIIASSEMDPSKLGWGALGVDIVIDCTGKFTSKEKAMLHIQAGAKKVIISAPAKGEVDATVVMGVNDNILTASMQIISNASCTTNCLAPMAKVLEENFGIECGYMTTVHAYTADQNLQDAPHKDLRRARAAALNIVPTTTGAAKAVGLVLPSLKGKLDGFAARVPVADGSLTDLTVILKREATKDQINGAMEMASQGELKGILQYSTEPLVSSDIIHNPYSCIFDSELTSSMGKLVKVVGWYDNEFGYSSRCIDLIVKLGKL